MGQQHDPGTAPDHAAPEPSPSGGKVHLPSLIADEFGTSRSQARMEIGMGTIEIDGEPWSGDKFDLPAEAIRGKRLVVLGEHRHYSLTYRG